MHASGSSSTSFTVGPSFPLSRFLRCRISSYILNSRSIMCGVAAGCTRQHLPHCKSQVVSQMPCGCCLHWLILSREKAHDSRSNVIENSGGGEFGYIWTRLIMRKGCKGDLESCEEGWCFWILFGRIHVRPHGAVTLWCASDDVEACTKYDLRRKHVALFVAHEWWVKMRLMEGMVQKSHYNVGFI